MASIEIPKQLKQLLEDSEFQAPIRTLTDRAGEILGDNKLAFFPDYTDHGISHIECVLKSEIELVPKQVWDDSNRDSNPRLLCDADAAVIIGATLLHDIAMHVRPSGFRELIGKESTFRPLPWFRESHEGHSADMPWHELWESYVREARRFSERDLTNIVGETSARLWRFESLPEDVGRWETNHYLVVGEFIRRHHARLAHEIAIYGFPGVPVGSGEGQFPAMGREQGHMLVRLADLIGLVARSHGMSLRVCKSYLDASALYPGTPKPMGTAVFYPMALLRVADYLQIDRQRAPAVLLQLRNPQSPISVQEWKKHRAVQNIGPATDPRGKLVTVTTDLGLPLYLQIRDLLAGLQAEMDHSTAVLDEVYGARAELGLNRLSLATRRVYSNVQSPAYRDSLAYVPQETGFTVDPNLLPLLVEPLYGKHPTVGVRELTQNASDAVCELDAWCDTRKVSVQSLDLPKQDGDVLIEFIQEENGIWLLRIRDRGIGMTADTIQNYFLRAGASFRNSSEWAKEFLDDAGKPRVVRAGRFGIGVFAIFLLGRSFRLWTRHVSADKSSGFMIEASENSKLVEISRTGHLQIGTTIEVELKSEAIQSMGLESPRWFRGIGESFDWFCWDWPKVVRRITRNGESNELAQAYTCAIRKGRIPPEWSVINHQGFDAIYWTFGDVPTLSCNGLVLAEPTGHAFHFADFEWSEGTQLSCPNIAVLDSGANLPVTIQRYALSRKTLPFTDDLSRDTTFSFIAHALVCGPRSPNEALGMLRVHPLAEKPDQNSFSQGCLRWCATSAELVPLDPWLYPLLNAQSCLVYGTLLAHSLGLSFGQRYALSEALGPGLAGVLWNGIYEAGHEGAKSPIEWEEKRLMELAKHGIPAMNSTVQTTRVLASTSVEFTLLNQSSKTNGGDVSTWRRTAGTVHGKHRFEIENGSPKPSNFLESIVDDMEKWSANKSDFDEFRPTVFYAAEIEMKRTMRAAESPIAKLWNECLGPRAIPFAPPARENLISEGLRHPELRRHIEAWRELERTGSKWTKIRSA